MSNEIVEFIGNSTGSAIVVNHANTHIDGISFKDYEIGILSENNTQTYHLSIRTLKILLVVEIILGNILVENNSFINNTINNSGGEIVIGSGETRNNTLDNNKITDSDVEYLFRVII